MVRYAIGYELVATDPKHRAALAARPEGQRLYRTLEAAQDAARRLRAEGIACIHRWCSVYRTRNWMEPLRRVEDPELLADGRTVERPDPRPR